MGSGSMEGSALMVDHSSPVSSDSDDVDPVHRLRDEVFQGFMAEHGGRFEQTHRRAFAQLRDRPPELCCLNVIAVQHLIESRVHRAMATLRSFGSAWEDCPLANRIAAQVSIETQSWSQAAARLRRAADLQPGCPDVWQSLGQIAEITGQPEKAICYYERGALFEQGTHGCATRLSRLYLSRRQLPLAISVIRSALHRDRRSATLNETYARLLTRRAALFRRRGESEAYRSTLGQIRACLRTAAASRPTTSLLMRIAAVELRREDFDGLRWALTETLRREPGHLAARTRLASLDVDEGDIDRARRQLVDLLDEEHPPALAHFRFSRIQTFSASRQTDEYVRRLRRQIQRCPRDDRQLVQLNFALAKVLDDVGRHDEAWEAYAAANRLKLSQRRRIDPTGIREIVDDQIASFTPSTVQRMARDGHESRLPIFVVGLPRSGTTLTEQILCSHSRVAGGGELKAIERLRRKLVRSVESRLGRSTHDGQAGGCDRMIGAVNANDIQSFAESYLDELRCHAGDADRVTDKMPTNFLHLGWIATAFPHATIIHCRRDPMDVIASAFCQNLSPPFCDPESLAEYVIQYRRLMAHWSQVLPGRIHHTDYETLVRQPEGSTRELLQFCGLSWEPECMNFHTTVRRVHTPSKFQVRQPMYQTSVAKWKRFERQLSPIASRLVAVRSV